MPERKTRCCEAWCSQFGKKKLDAGSLWQFGKKTRCWEAWWREKTRCWEAWYWQYGKKKLDAGKLGIGCTERKKLMLGSLVLAVQKEKKLHAGKLSIDSSERKTRCWEAWYWQFGSKKLDARKLDIGCTERKKLMLGSLVLAV